MINLTGNYVSFDSKAICSAVYKLDECTRNQTLLRFIVNNEFVLHDNFPCFQHFVETSGLGIFHFANNNTRIEKYVDRPCKNKKENECEHFEEIENDIELNIFEDGDSSYYMSYHVNCSCRISPLFFVHVACTLLILYL